MAELQSKDFKTLPQPPSHWLFRHVLDLKKEGLMDFIKKNRLIHGDMFTADTGIEKILVLSKPEHVKYVLVDNQKNYIKSYGYKILRIFFGNGLLTNEGESWMHQRRLAQPAFHKKRLETLTRYMVEESVAMAKEWETTKAKGEPFMLSDDMSRVTMLIVARALFGADVSDKIDRISEGVSKLNEYAVKRIMTPFPLPLWIPTPQNLKATKLLAEMDEILYGLISQRRKSTEQHDDLLQMLMEAQDEETGIGMTDQQLRDEVMTIFVAGHETTALAMSWTWYLLSQNPEVEAKLHAELTEVLGDRDPEFSDFPRLKYTRQVIDEVMRKYPPAWLIGRKPVEEDEIGGYSIPNTVNVLLATHEIHHHPDFWTDPDTFDPDRFSEENVKNIPKYAYFPFGGGPRLCIGNNFAMMEMTFLLATLAKQFSLRLAPGHPVELEPLITLRPKYGMKMIFN